MRSRPSRPFRPPRFRPTWTPRSQHLNFPRPAPSPKSAQQLACRSDSRPRRTPQPPNPFSRPQLLLRNLSAFFTPTSPSNKPRSLSQQPLWSYPAGGECFRPAELLSTRMEPLQWHNSPAESVYAGGLQCLRQQL